MALLDYMERRRLWKQRVCDPPPPPSTYLERRRVYFNQVPCSGSGGDKEMLGGIVPATNPYVAGDGLRYFLYSSVMGTPTNVGGIIDRPLFAADLAFQAAANTLDGLAALRVFFVPVPGGPAFAYGTGLTIPAGSTALLQVAGDLAGAPIPAGSEVLFGIESPASTVGAITGFEAAARSRTV